MHIKLLLIEKNEHLAQQVISLLDPIENIAICGCATTLEDSIKLIEWKQPQIVLLELNLNEEHGVTLSANLKRRFPQLHIIVYTGYDYVPFFNQLIESGVSGMLNKSASAEELTNLLTSVMHGKTIVPLKLFNQIKLHRSDHVKHYWEFDLTPTEQHILELIYERYTNALIAKKIHLSESSVEKYLRKIYDKLGVRNKIEAIERMQQDLCFRPVNQHSEL